MCRKEQDMTPEHKKRVELERSIKEMIKTCRKIIRFQKKDSLAGGICNTPLIKRLSELEKQLQGKKKKQLPYERLQMVGREVAKIVSGICKSLVSYFSPFGNESLNSPI